MVMTRPFKLIVFWQCGSCPGRMHPNKDAEHIDLHVIWITLEPRKGLTTCKRHFQVEICLLHDFQWAQAPGVHNLRHMQSTSETGEKR